MKKIIEEDYKTRQEYFQKKYGELVIETDVDFVQYPMWVPEGTNEGTGAFRTIIQNQPFDMKLQKLNQKINDSFVSKE